MEGKLFNLKIPYPMTTQLDSRKSSLFKPLEHQAPFCLLRLVETIVSVDVMKTMPIHFWLEQQTAIHEFNSSEYLQDALLKNKKRIIVFFYQQEEMMYQILFGDHKGGIHYETIHSVNSPYAIIHDPDPTDESVEHWVLAPSLALLDHNN